MRNGLPDVIQYVDLCKSISSHNFVTNTGPQSSLLEQEPSSHQVDTFPITATADIAAGGFSAEAPSGLFYKQRTGSGTSSLPETQPLGKRL